jgi:hypothetical protein
MAEIENNLNDGRQLPILVSDYVVKKRMDICKKCIHFMKNTEQCDICLCIMPYKARNAESFCPIHKWSAV